MPQSTLINRFVAMNAQERNWTLMVLRNGKRAEAVNLSKPVTTIGRDDSNDIVLPDSSVSRHHARICSGPDGLRVQDLKSHNGVKVNGVPRVEATVQDGDRLEIGCFTFELATAGCGQGPFLSLQHAVEDAARSEQTIDDHIRLPESRQERYLSALYHVCFWVAEGVEENAFVPRCLRLLLETLRAQEVQLYSAELELEAQVSENESKPSVKFATFLARKFQESAEAVVIPGREVAQHQQRVGQYNYLVGPLRTRQSAGAAGSPFLVFIRPGDWQDFNTEDRVLLQAICQLWARGRAKAHQVQELRQENVILRQKVKTPSILGASAALDDLRAKASKVAALNLTVLLQGETGSGKEVVAEFIHESSPRRAGPFIRVNCAAIPESLFESELFGHLRGAFTDAKTNRAGRFSQADGGTLFLDEVGDMPLFVQAKVLRAIELGEIEPLGAESVRKVDVRIVAATNRDLAGMVQQQQFRQDLFYRLNVLNIRVPPLREHLDDVQELAGHFLEKFCSESGLPTMEFSSGAMDLLKRYAWPGNVRELRNVVQRCAALAIPPLITERAVTEQLGASSPGSR